LPFRTTMQKLWLHQQCFYFSTVKYIYERWEHGKHGRKVKERGKKIGK
jgi:hypothetical protein